MSCSGHVIKDIETLEILRYYSVKMLKAVQISTPKRVNRNKIQILLHCVVCSYCVGGLMTELSDRISSEMSPTHRVLNVSVSTTQNNVKVVIHRWTTTMLEKFFHYWVIQWKSFKLDQMFVLHTIMNCILGLHK